MKTMALAVAVAVLCSAAFAKDQIKMNAKGIKADPLRKQFVAHFRGLRDGHVLYENDVDPAANLGPKKQTAQFGGFGLNQQGPSNTQPKFPVAFLDSIAFDGTNDWLTVVMKNGDVIRGEAESMNANTLRIKGVEKAVRMMNVREISATDPPAEPAAE